MFTAKHIRDLMRTNPFRPFKIKMSDGSSYEVPNHDAALITRNFVEVGIDLDTNEIPGRVARCSILHIANIEDLQPA
ncbi:MAG: hypothetical protein ACREFE_03335 [Limisphaerales bacterium]